MATYQCASNAMAAGIKLQRRHRIKRVMRAAMDWAGSRKIEVSRESDSKYRLTAYRALMDMRESDMHLSGDIDKSVIYIFSCDSLMRRFPGSRIMVKRFSEASGADSQISLVLTPRHWPFAVSHFC